jgi:hypothetical protein
MLEKDTKGEFAMKNVLSETTALCTTLTMLPQALTRSENRAPLPFELDPVYQCPEASLDNQCHCAKLGCTATFPVRYGVCFTSWWPFEETFAYGMCVFCSLDCLLDAALIQGMDVLHREFRDTEQTLH